jgi:hypothetical protein
LWALRSLAFLLRLSGSLGYYLCRLVINVFDLVIFPAIWLETLIQRKLEVAKQKPVKQGRSKKQTQSIAMLEETVPCENPAD